MFFLDVCLGGSFPKQEWVNQKASHPGSSPERFARGGRPKVTDVLEVDEIVSLGGLQHAAAGDLGIQLK